MKTLELSTNLIGLDGLFCTYHGLGNTDHFDCAVESDYKEGYSEVSPEYFWEHYDNSKYMAWWDKTIQDGLDEVICDAFKYHLDMQITYTGCGYWSPREYNFRHDTNNFNLEADSFDKLLNYCEENSEEFSKFLKNHYTSCDGFLSHTSNNIESWRRDIGEDDMTAWGAAVRFFLHNVVDIYDFESILTDHEMYHMPHEFVNYTALDEFKEEIKLFGKPLSLDDKWKKEYFLENIADINKVRQYVQQEYMSNNEVINKYLQETYTEEFDFIPLIEEVKSEIDSRTLKLNITN